MYMIHWFNSGLLFGFGLIVAYLAFKLLEDLHKKSKARAKKAEDREEARPKYVIKSLPLNITQGNYNHSFTGIIASIFTVREGDEKIRVNNPGDLNFRFNNSEGKEVMAEWDNSQGERSYAIGGYDIPVHEKHYQGEVNFYLFSRKGIVKVNSITLKKGVTVRALMIESRTDEGEDVCWFYGDGIDAQFVSEDNPTLKKYKKLVTHSIRYRVYPEEDVK